MWFICYFLHGLQNIFLGTIFQNTQCINFKKTYANERGPVWTKLLNAIFFSVWKEKYKISLFCVKYIFYV